LHEHFTRHPVAGLDGALHAAGPDPVVGVLAGKKHPSVKWRRNDGQHRVALVADRRPDHGARPRVLRPALDETEQSLDWPPDDRAHRGVDAVEDLLVSKTSGFDVARRQARDDDGPTALMDRLLHDKTRHAIRETARSD